MVRSHTETAADVSTGVNDSLGGGVSAGFLDQPSSIHVKASRLRARHLSEGDPDRAAGRCAFLV